ncbi:CGNR zinc finger domain-containing protein [Ornithinimicrobium sp. INDO-MA30-4]|uniref:CGNR zinc finger domain-containing protein n=1 Tax=Ornithinimicrobium sp. INDO-MA30-4 TaxID=2908651 RepID=UPI001F19D578|nr:CGNR zinc finger domain-containing protein [Ornithinimicrobium sp. INDO-MA30-4]UJH70271.1 CGNR zinc finger domain-containing protein [Ornithinimicrobium sp. INDO-MA30-4]
MQFAHDTEDALVAAEVLINTASEPDTLTTLADLADLVRQHRWTGFFAGDAAELKQVRALRPRLRAIWLADEAEQAEGINALLREGKALPQLVRHDEFDWHPHATTQESPLAIRMSVEAAMALIDVMRAGERSRLETCDADDCDNVYVDLSRNRSRRFCGTTCSNRVAAAAYRARQSEESEV